MEAGDNNNNDNDGDSDAAEFAEAVNAAEDAAAKKMRERQSISNEPLTKKLRYSEPDLTIVVQCADGDGDGDASDAEKQKEQQDKTTTTNKKKKKKYPMYKAQLAGLSDFIDACLSNPSKEQDSGVIELDVEAQHFEKAIQFLKNVVAARSMTPEDAMDMVVFYNKYMFQQGLKLCDHVLNGYLQKQPTNGKKPPKNLDFIVEILVTADSLELPITKASCLQYFQQLLNNMNEVPFGPTMLQLEHVEKLHGLFKEELAERVAELLQITEKDIESELFPKYFVLVCAQRASQGLLKSFSLEGANGIRGQFIPVRTSTRTQSFVNEGGYDNWNGDAMTIFVEQYTDLSCNGDWAIVAKSPTEEYVLWKCPYSRNLNYPPKKGFQPIHKAAKGQVKLKYEKFQNNNH